MVMEAVNVKTIDQIKVGDTACYAKTVTEADVMMFAQLSGDFAPQHVSKAFGETTMFHSRIAHGMLSAGFISNVLGMKLPGPGTIYLSQELKFTKPVYINDTVTATATVVEKIEEKNRLVLETICTNQKGDVVIKGKAVVMPPAAE